MFDSEYFIDWFKHQLLPSIRGCKCLICLDNAAYHCTKPTSVPKLGSKKADIAAFLTSKGVTVNPKDLLPALKDKLRVLLDDNSLAEIRDLAKAEGHEVLFQPPHHSDLNPIELLWNDIKGTVGRQYDSDTTLAQVGTRARKAFTEVLTAHDKIQAFFDHTAKVAAEYAEGDDIDCDDGVAGSDSDSTSSDATSSDESDDSGDQDDTD